jgi:hypothetical protein
VVPPETDIVELIEPTEEVTDRFRRAISVDYAMIQRGAGRPMVQMMLSAGSLPEDGAFDVLIRSGDDEYPVGYFTTASMAGNMSFGSFAGQTQHHFAANIGQLSGSRFDVVLRPNADLARFTVDIKRVYGGQIVIPDVQATGMPGGTGGGLGTLLRQMLGGD